MTMTKGLGLALGVEDIKRITHAVGAMSLALLTHVDSDDDIKEAVAMHELHGRLIQLLEKATDEVAKDCHAKHDADDEN